MKTEMTGQERMPDTDLEVRLALKHMDATPCVGKNYDLILFENGQILSVLGGRRSIETAAPLSRLGLAEKEEAELSAFLQNGGRMAAYSLTGTRGTLLAFGLPGFPGRGMGILPYASGAGVERVIRASFQPFIDGTTAPPPLQTSVSGLREDDCTLYELLATIVSLWQKMLGNGAVDSRCRGVRYMLGRISLLLGMSPFRLDAPERRTTAELDAVPTAGMAYCFLCLTVGLCRGIPRMTGKASIVFTDAGWLQLTLPTGNRTRIPPEWCAASRMAEACGISFRTERHRNAIELFLCPMPSARKVSDGALIS